MGIAALLLLTLDTAKAAGMEGGKHDLTRLGGGLDLCEYCHGRSVAPGGQLAGWSRTDSDVFFRPYSSPTMDATMVQPGNESRLCLSCHDGVIAFDALNGLAGTPGNNMRTMLPGSTAIMGHDLSDDHPVGVDVAIDSRGIKHRSVIEAAGVTLYDGKVECSSCHDVHGKSGYKRLLRVDPKLLCLSCHNK